MQQQTGKIIKIVDPQEIKDQYKKGQVVIQWEEQAKEKSFTKQLATEVFSKKENFDKRWNYIVQNFSVGDNVEVSFDVVSNEGKGNWFTSAKYINMKHQDKDVSGGQQQSSPQMPDSDDDSLPF